MHGLTPQLAAVFVAPALAVAGAVAVGVPVAIHLLSRMRRQPVNWGAMRFLEMAYRQQRSRIRLESWLLLAVRCLLVLVAGLALAGPVLRGCAAQVAGSLEATGRTVYLVLDDGLSSRARETADRTRLDRHRDAALSVIDGLDPGDRVALWFAARPARPGVADPTADHDRVRSELMALTARHSVSDLPAALEQVAERLGRDPVSAGRDAVVVLSDFPASAGYLAVSAPSALEGLGDRASVVVSNPSAVVGNVQIVSVRPRRAMVLTGGPGGGSVAVAVRLRRIGSGSGRDRTPVELTLTDPGGRVISALQREVVWSPGQVEAGLNGVLPLESSRGGLSSGRAQVVVRIGGGSDGGGDGLEADNTAWATVRVREGLTVGLVGGSSSDEGLDGFDAGRLVRAALSPGAGGEGGSVAVVGLAPDRLNAGALASCDAVFVLRPDRVPGPSWLALGDWARGGGVVWVTAPSEGGAAVWGDALVRAFGVDWKIGLEPVDRVAGSDFEPTAGIASGVASGVASGGTSGVGRAGETSGGLDLRGGVPEALEMLGADWADLLSPVRVSRSLVIDAPDEDVWLRLAGGGSAQNTDRASGDGLGVDRARVTSGVGHAGATSGGGAVLVGRGVGRGSLLLLATPLDVRWTNLPTKPLFVPLLHEALRGELGAARGGVGPFVSGDRLILPDEDETAAPGYRWRRVSGGSGNGASDAGGMIESAGVLDVPGVYVAEVFPGQSSGEVLSEIPGQVPGSLPGSVARGQLSGVGVDLITVNVPALAGDTRPVDLPRLRSWLSGLGPWRFLDPAAPGGVFADRVGGVDLGWALLWVVLVLLVAETVLARGVSHAYNDAEAGLTRRVLGRWVGGVVVGVSLRGGGMKSGRGGAGA